MSVESLWEKAGKYLKPEELKLLRRAYDVALAAHGDQERVSGEPYIEHPVAVAEILASLELDISTLMASLLHDVVEDTAVSLEQLEAEFGSEVAQLVDGVTKLSRLENRSREERQAENIRKMILAMARDVRVILIKLADRLHNLRTLKSLPEARQRAIAHETLEIFAPLAHRLGIYSLKWELEDLALRYEEPERYRELVSKVARKRQEREAYIESIIEYLQQELGRHDFEADITGRPKNFYSIYRKMYNQGKDFSQIYDLVAIRVLVETVKDCYGVLGVVHALWKPIPGRFKDYIAMPKPNLYQSLHTTVIGPTGEPFEIQIRTWEMHRTSEYGIAAHWRYKDGAGGDQRFEKKISWLRQVLEWQHDLKDPREFMESLKIDLFDEDVFVFTPKGTVVDLPAGAIPVDFAYRIHTDIGHHCVGAKANGKIVPLDYRLRNGDIVEILTNKNSAGPSADWLKLVKTSGARNRIRQFLKGKNREENIQIGREILDRESRRQGIEPKEVLRQDFLEEVRGKLKLGSMEDLLAAVGNGGLSAGQVLNRLKERRTTPSVPAAEPERKRSAPRKNGGGIMVKGVENVLVRLSRCCNPVPGDQIVGYITRGRGVSVHRLDCPNVPELLQEPDRVIEVEWEAPGSTAYPVEIEIHALDRAGLLADVAQVVAELKLNIFSAKARGYKNKTALVNVLMEVHDLKELSGIVRRIEGLPAVLEVKRVARETSHGGSNV